MFSLEPFSKNETPLRLRAQVTSLDEGLRVDFVLEGANEVKGLCDFAQESPSPSLARELWKSTCFELFVKVPHSTQYWEWNFAPHGEVGHFAFSDRRVESLPWPRALGESGVRRLEGSLDGSTYRLTVELGFAPIPTLFWNWITRSQLELSLTAVIETRGGETKYWALKHASDKPDFHDPQSFVAHVARGA